MLNSAKKHKAELSSIAKKHFVEKLYLFGSATNENFDIETSDLDFVVEFSKELPLLDYADNFFSLKDALEQLFNRKVDLLTTSSIKNEILLKEIENSKVELYAA